MMGIAVPETRWAYKKSRLHAITIACSSDTTPTKPHLTSNLQETKNETTNVVINIIVASFWWRA